MEHVTPQQWADALESGEYEQVVGALVNPRDKRYCCLGVLSDLAIKAGYDRARWGENLSGQNCLLIRTGLDSDGTPLIAGDIIEEADDGEVWVEEVDGQVPQEMAEWLNIDTNPVLDGVAAITRNDSHQESFTKIAEAIRRTDL